MAKNTGEDFRKGSVNNRTQVQNPENSTWVKRDAGNGQFMGAKSGDPYKGVAKEADHRRTKK
jgi:hypothetical protein